MRDIVATNGQQVWPWLDRTQEEIYNVRIQKRPRFRVRYNIVSNASYIMPFQLPFMWELSLIC